VKRLSAVLASAALLVGCGDDDAPPAGSGNASGGSGGSGAERSVQGPTRSDEAREPASRPGTEIVTGSSEFGEMLFSPGDRAIYVFENDPRDESVCYGECADAWPPVVTKGEPVAGRGTAGDLLGTTERRDGSTQVTYAGRPLYFYAHENPGEVRCHNVDLNGGLWWVVGPDGAPRA
jgi:predicted lipoprotein with Yx(FWY)xxD motif